MKPIIEFSQVLQDSPKFREILEQNEDDIDEFEHKLEKALKQCQVLIDGAKTFQAIKENFLIQLTDLAFHFRCDRTVFSTLNKVVNTMQEVEGFNRMLLDNVTVTLIKSLNEFIKGNIKSVKETKKYFDKISDDLDSALQRHSQMSRTKPHEGDAENINVLDAFRSCFRHTALDYVSQISCHQSKKRYEILELYLTIMSAYNNYFTMGSELMSETQPAMKQARENIRMIQEETAELTRDLDGRHNIVTSKDIVPILIRNPNPPNFGIRIEGYLFKRGTNAFKTWNRRWFIVDKNQLIYRKRQHDDPSIMEPDLKLCTVKSVFDVDRKYCFEVVSPTKNHVLQADSEESYLQWVAALQEGINVALQAAQEETPMGTVMTSMMSDSIPSNSSSLYSEKVINNAFSILMAVSGNELCCDCKQEAPKWASINLGVTLCIECSGIHRGLGVHVSKVRSLTLDAWEPELLKVMASLGNTLANQVYLALPPPRTFPPITPSSNRPEREAWIKAKYVDKAMVKNPFSTNSVEAIQTTIHTEEQKKILNMSLYEASVNMILPDMFKSLAIGANPNWQNTHDKGRYCLHMTVLAGSMQCTEYLLLNGAKINVLDNNNVTPLHLATELGHTGLVCLLLKRGANQHIKNRESRDALDIAVATTNADIVTLLRLARFNEEMRNEEYGLTGDDMFNEVVRDFSNMASNFPEKLQRKPQTEESVKPTESEE